MFNVILNNTFKSILTLKPRSFNCNITTYSTTTPKSNTFILDQQTNNDINTINQMSKSKLNSVKTPTKENKKQPIVDTEGNDDGTGEIISTNPLKRFFTTQKDFASWLKDNHNKVTELYICFYKKSSGKVAINYNEALEECLCWGWIDGVRKAIDDISYCNRYTPRRKNSNWSAINIAHVHRLIKEGKMMPSGMAEFEKRNHQTIEDAKKAEAPTFSDSQWKRIKKNPDAYEFFSKQSESYKKHMQRWALGAKRQETIDARIDKIIEVSEQEKRLK